ncbi:MAG: hypothetical protein EB038_03450 [Cyclobacteriaceae bacterium]|nr:hypothetical protein [Cyclobacteriaceae bacterium]
MGGLGRQSGIMRGYLVFALGWLWISQGQAQGKWGMVDTNGTMRIPERYDEIGVFRGDLARGLCLPEFLPGVQGGKILRWLKMEGQEVKVQEILVQVELKDPSLPLLAPVSGMLTKIGVPAGGAVIPGSALGIVRVLGTVDLFAKKQYDVEWTNSSSATVVRWLKLEGDAVLKGEKIAEIREKLAAGTATTDDLKTAVALMREGRVAAITASYKTR